jgi:hypothetical protein
LDITCSTISWGSRLLLANRVSPTCRRILRNAIPGWRGAAAVLGLQYGNLLASVPEHRVILQAFSSVVVVT